MRNPFPNNLIDRIFGVEEFNTSNMKGLKDLDVIVRHSIGMAADNRAKPLDQQMYFRIYVEYFKDCKKVREISDSVKLSMTRVNQIIKELVQNLQSDPFSIHLLYDGINTEELLIMKTSARTLVDNLFLSNTTLDYLHAGNIYTVQGVFDNIENGAIHNICPRHNILETCKRISDTMILIPDKVYGFFCMLETSFNDNENTCIEAL